MSGRHGQSDWEYQLVVGLERYEGDPEYRLFYDQISGIVRVLLHTDVEKLEKQRSHGTLEAIELYSHHNMYRMFHDRVSELIEGYLEEPKTNKQRRLESEDPLRRYKCDIDYRKVHDRIYYHILGMLQTYHDHDGQSLGMEDVSGLIDEVLKPVKDQGASKYNKESLKKMRKACTPTSWLPHEILRRVHSELEQEGELFWNGLLEIFSGSKFRKWTAVCDVDIGCSTMSVALGLFISDLAEGAWRGKVMNYSKEPCMYRLRGVYDVRSRSKMVGAMDAGGREIDLEKIYDLILERAVKKNLTARQMVKKVLVLTARDFDAEMGRQWEASYAKIQIKYQEKGYAVPTMVFWSLLWNPKNVVVPRQYTGVKTLMGVSNSIIVFFLINEGSISTDKFRKYFHLA